MKVAISGKGGVGKTTIAAGLASLWAGRGGRVIAIDADPDANLASALGASAEQAAACEPLSRMDELIEERTGSRPGAGGFFRLDPDVSDILGRCGVLVGGVTLLRMGTVERGGSGCMCSDSTFLKAFLRHLLVERTETVVVDLEAGIEHLGRGTAESVDVLVVVVDSGSRSLQTARVVSALAADLRIPLVVAVANRVRSAEEESHVRDVLGDIPLLAILPDSEGVRLADREGRPTHDADPAFAMAIEDVATALESAVAEARQEDTHAGDR